MIIVEMFDDGVLREANDVFNEIGCHISTTSEKIRLRFAWDYIKPVPSCWLNEAVGQLLSKYTKGYLQDRLMAENINKCTAADLRKVCENAVRYFEKKGGI